MEKRFPDELRKNISGIEEKGIQQDRQSGIRSGVNGTPTFFMNGTRYDGPHDFPSLRAALEVELEPGGN